MDRQSTHSGDLPFALYHAFTARPYSGSPAAILLNTAGLAREDRLRIARETGLPATAFVDAVAPDRVVVQFFSTVMELPMCGHGTMCLITSLVDWDLLPPGGGDWHPLSLVLPNGAARVEYRRTPSGRTEIMLDVAAASLSPARLDEDRLADLLGVARSDFSADLPLMVSKADFSHLCLPMQDLAAAGRITPDFPGLAQYCRDNGVDTVAAYCLETVDPAADLHVRDFCPAVGVWESAAAGTTNAALAASLRHLGAVAPQSPGHWHITAEQGIELGRASRITTAITASETDPLRIQVGGVASRVMVGHLTPGNAMAEETV